MANEFHHHPDNLIFIRTDVGIYQDTPENFAIDMGAPYAFEGRERLYEPGVRHFVDGEPQSLKWTNGDGYIAAVGRLITAKSERETIPETPDPKLTYRQLRAADYIAELSPEGTFQTSVGDLLDAIIKFLYGDDNSKLDALVTIINQIKAKYPPPQ
ncbi:MAG: hypothetical protein ACE5FZ_06620 [Nitrospiria bacterium]